jgi:hypothetical protein
MELFADSIPPINIPDGFWGWLLGIAAIILIVVGIVALALLGFTARCLSNYPTALVGKVAWICVMVFFFPFGSALYFLAYFLFGRNAQGGVDANREDRNYLVKCRQCGEGILWNVESCTQCGEPRPSG